MKKLLLALALWAIPSLAFGQCTGVFPANTVCGNLSGSPAPPSAFATGGLIIGPGSSTLNGLPLWANTLGTQLKDGAGQTIVGAYTWSGAQTLSSTINQTGSGSGTVTLQTQAAAGTWNWNWPTSAGSPNQVLTSQGGVGTAMQWKGANLFTGPILFQSLTNVGGITSAVMLGFGSTCVLTPSTSTRAYVVFTGVLANNTASDGGAVQIRFGTGTAPVNGAAVTGTLISVNISSTGNANSAGLGFPLSAIGMATGLTPGTTYWFDVALSPIGGGTVTFLSVGCIGFEI